MPPARVVSEGRVSWLVAWPAGSGGGCLLEFEEVVDGADQAPFAVHGGEAARANRRYPRLALMLPKTGSMLVDRCL